jgi:hypothetical protein
VDTLLRARRGRVDLPRRRNRLVDRRLESICLKCLERRPRRRYPSARALADDLDLWQRRRRPRAHRLQNRAGRLVRRHPLLTLLLLLGLAALAAPVVNYLTSQERALKLAVARLEKGEEVVWIGKTGRPLFSRPALPYGSEIIGRADDGAFVFGSDTIAFLELVPDPQVSHYILSAEVRRQDVKLGGDVGLYCCHSQHGVAGNPLWRHWYCVVRFNDSLESGQTWTTLRVEHHLQPSILRQSDACRSPGIKYARSGQKGWHKIAVEVSPTELTLRFDDQPPQTTSRRELNDTGEDLYGDMLGLRAPAPKPPLNPRGALGLYAVQGTASFRNAVVKPLKPVSGE